MSRRRRRRRRYELVAFDVDGTLVGNKQGKVVWNLFNERFAPPGADVEQRMADYLDGKFSYEHWVDLDIRDWVAAGSTRQMLADIIAAELHLITGAREMLQALSERQFQLAVISGTLDLTLDVLLPDHPFDTVFTNAISFDDDGLISGWKATPYDMEGKAVALKTTAEQNGISLNQTVYVGDNINDIEAMRAAGLAIAFEPKHASVSDVADAVISDDLRRLIDLLA